MSFEISKSQNTFDYEILIRRRAESEYASYCPQLNYMITGEQHEEVEQKMQAYIQEHITKISNEG
jgi:predicted RNase H-like HicB family nuclease